jgi:hypothetical protein
MTERERDVDTESRTQAPAPVLSLNGPDQDTLLVEEEFVAFERPPSPLCHFCQEIVKIWNAKYAGPGILLDHHVSLPALKASSENGCGICAQMLFVLDQDHSVLFELGFQVGEPHHNRALCARPCGAGWEIGGLYSWEYDSQVRVQPALTPGTCYISKCVPASNGIAHFD